MSVNPFESDRDQLWIDKTNYNPIRESLEQDLGFGMTAADLRKLPSTHKQSMISVMPMARIFDVLSRESGASPTPQDVASFLVEMEAGYDLWQRIFDDGSLQGLVERGLITPPQALSLTGLPVGTDDPTLDMTDPTPGAKRPGLWESGRFPGTQGLSEKADEIGAFFGAFGEMFSRGSQGATAPAFLKERDDADKYISSWFIDQRRKAWNDIREGNTLGGYVRFAGSYVGTLGRINESLSSELRIWYAAHIAGYRLRGIGPAPKDEAERQLLTRIWNQVYESTDIESDLGFTPAQQIAVTPQEMRDFWDSAADDWPVGIKGFLENLVEFGADAAMPPLGIAKKAKTIAKNTGVGLRKASTPLVEGLSVGLTQFPGLTKAFRLSLKPYQYLRELPIEQKITVLERDMSDLLGDVMRVHNPEGNVAKAVTLIEDLTSQAVDARPISDFLSDVVEARVKQRTVLEETVKTARGQMPGQGPVNRIDLAMYKVDPVTGGEWPLSKVQADALAQMRTNFSSSLGIFDPDKGLLLRRAHGVLKKGLGWAYLYSSPGFYLIQFNGGLAAISQRFGRQTFMAPSRLRWMNRLNNFLNGEEGDFAGETMRLVYTAQTDPNLAAGLVGELTEGVGRHGPKGGLEKLEPSYLPVIGDHLLAQWDFHVPDKFWKWKSYPEQRIRLPGLSGVVKFATGQNEAGQHTLAQAISGQPFMVDTLSRKLDTLDFGPDSVRIRNRITQEFSRMDTDVVTERGLRKIMSELAEAGGNTFRVITKPRDVIPSHLLNDNIRPFLEKRLLDLEKLGKPATGFHIRNAFTKAATDVQDQALKDIGLAFSQMDGAFGKEAFDLLQIYKKTGKTPDDQTVSLIANMLNREQTLHDITEQIIQSGTKSAQEFRALGTGVGREISEKLTARLETISEQYQNIHINKSKRSAAHMGEVQKALARLKRAEKRKGANIPALRSTYHSWDAAAQKQLNDQTYKEFKALSDGIIPEQFRQHVEASVRTSIRPSSSDMVQQTLPRKFTLKEGVDPLLVTKRIMEDVADALVPVNAKWRDIRQKTLLAGGDIAPVWEQWLIEQGDAYVKAAARHNVKVNNPARWGNTQANFKAIIKAVDAENGNRRMMELLDDRNIGSFFQAEAKRNANKIIKAADDAASAWNNPYVVAGNKVTLKQLQQIVNETINEGRSYMASESAAVLFSYAKNRGHIAMDMIFPFSYWAIKWGALQAKQALTNPGQLHAFLRVMSRWQKDNEDLPPHLQYTIRIHTLEDGTQLRINIAQFIAPVLGGGEAFTLIRPGTDEEFTQHTLGFIEILNSMGFNSVSPAISAIMEAPKHLLDLEGNMDKEVYKDLFGDFGLIQPTANLLGSLGGNLQSQVREQWAAGNLPGLNPDHMLKWGLTESQRDAVGYVVQSWMMEGGRLNEAGEREEITHIQALETIVAIEQGDTSNALAMAAMQEWSSNEMKFTQMRFLVRGFRDYEASYAESRRLNAEYWTLRTKGDTDEAQRFLEANPGIVVGWVINKDLPEQEKRLRVARWYSVLDQIYAADTAAREKLNVYDQDEFDRLDEDLRVAIDAARQASGVSDEDLQYTPKTNTPEERMKIVIKIMNDQIQYDNFNSPAEYYEMRNGFITKWVDESQVELMEQLLVSHQSLPEAIWDVYGDMYVRKYLSSTENLSVEGKELYLSNNPLPSIEEIAQKIHALYRDEDGQPRWDIDTILDKIASNKGLSLQGYLNVNQRAKEAKVEADATRTDANGQQIPDVDRFTFTSPSGKTVNADNLEEFRRATEDWNQWRDTKLARDKANESIREIHNHRDTALARFSVMDILAGKANDTLSHYHTVLAVAYRKKESDSKPGQPGASGKIPPPKIAPWTDRMTEWYSSDEHNAYDDQLNLWRKWYADIDPEDFRDNAGVKQWGEFYDARKEMMEEIITTAKGEGVTRRTIQKEIWKNKSPNELVAMWWEEKVLRPATDEWFAVKYKDRTPELWLSIARKYNTSSTVKDQINALKRAFPWITNGQWGTIYMDSLPNWAAYYQSREDWIDPTTSAASGSRTSIVPRPGSSTNIPPYSGGSTNIPPYSGGSTRIPGY